MSAVSYSPPSPAVRSSGARWAFVVALLSFGTAAVAQPYRVDTVARAPRAQYPVALAFAPDATGKLFFTEKKSGRVRVFNRFLLPDPFLTVPVEDDGPQGLLGITVHPAYPDSPYVYIFYTRAIDRSNVVERYRDSAGTGINPRLLFLIPRLDDGSANSGGGLAFGTDGKLYVSVGDYGTNPNDAQEISSRRNNRGKILRLNHDGSIPEDNPIPDQPFWSYGHRNPFGIAFDAVTGTLYCTDNGTQHTNEVNVVPRGANLGWPTENDAQHRLLAFTGGTQPGLSAIAVYRDDAFPRLRGKILFGGYLDQTLWVGTLSAAGDTLIPEPFFRTNAGYADIKVGPDGSIYMVNGPYISSRILRLVPVAPVFVSDPPLEATQDRVYEYAPVFRGTAPSLSVIVGPDGMAVDSTTWTVRWVPTNDQALGGFHSVTLRAQNGAGYADQSYTISVTNVNDPPRAFALLAPPDSDFVYSAGSDPEVVLEWEPSRDPDRDSISYVLELDTTIAFVDPVRRIQLDSSITGLRLLLPRRSAMYYWRVRARDGRRTVTSSPDFRVFSVSFVVPVMARDTRSVAREPVTETAYAEPVPQWNAITYTNPREGRVRLSVFNLLGQELAVLVDAVQPAGTYQLDIGGREFPNGIYFYRVHGPGFFETRKIIVTR